MMSTEQGKHKNRERQNLKIKKKKIKKA